jgi:hypothetical protein
MGVASNIPFKMKTTDQEKLKRARKRVEELRGFYIHLAIYLFINSFITVNKMIRNHYNGETLGESFWDFGTFAVWVFWGIGLAFHAFKVFQYNPLFGKKWEERQIRKYMEKDREQAEKFK